MTLREDAQMDRIYRQMRTLATLRLRAAAQYDAAWIATLEQRRERCESELSRAWGADGRHEDLRTAA